MACNLPSVEEGPKKEEMAVGRDLGDPQATSSYLLGANSLVLAKEEAHLTPKNTLRNINSFKETGDSGGPYWYSAS